MFSRKNSSRTDNSRYTKPGLIHQLSLCRVAYVHRAFRNGLWKWIGETFFRNLHRNDNTNEEESANKLYLSVNSGGDFFCSCSYSKLSCSCPFNERPLDTESSPSFTLSSSVVLLPATNLLFLVVLVSPRLTFACKSLWQREQERLEEAQVWSRLRQILQLIHARQLWNLGVRES